MVRMARVARTAPAVVPQAPVVAPPGAMVVRGPVAGGLAVVVGGLVAEGLAVGGLAVAGMAVAGLVVGDRVVPTTLRAPSAGGAGTVVTTSGACCGVCAGRCS
jgi:hypothetical protein